MKNDDENLQTYKELETIAKYSYPYLFVTDTNIENFDFLQTDDTARYDQFYKTSNWNLIKNKTYIQIDVKKSSNTKRKVYVSFPFMNADEYSFNIFENNTVRYVKKYSPLPEWLSTETLLFLQNPKNVLASKKKALKKLGKHLVNKYIVQQTFQEYTSTMEFLTELFKSDNVQDAKNKDNSIEGINAVLQKNTETKIEIM